MTRSFDEIKNLPQHPGIYGFKSPTDVKEGSYSYVGLSGKIRNRVTEHLLRRDSSVTTGASATSLNPDKIAECNWWCHKTFVEKEYLEAAELIAFEKLNPTLGSRGSPSSKALELSQDKKFISQMEELFSSPPTGSIVFHDLSWAVSKIRELENEIKLLKEKLK
jgi:hypothetical protein